MTWISCWRKHWRLRVLTIKHMVRKRRKQPMVEPLMARTIMEMEMEMAKRKSQRFGRNQTTTALKRMKTPMRKQSRNSGDLMGAEEMAMVTEMVMAEAEEGADFQMPTKIEAEARILVMETNPVRDNSALYATIANNQDME